MTSSLDLALIIGYIAVVIGIGFWSSRRQSAGDFLIHNRTLGTFALIATISASWTGGGAIIAYGAYVYEYGIAALSVYVGFCLCMFTFARFAPMIRAKAVQFNHLTLGDYFEEHVGRRAGLAIAVVSGIAYLLFLTNQFIAGSSILSVLTGWSYDLALFTCGSVVLIYLLLGGMRSVVKTDIFQYVVMVVLLIALGFAMTKQTGLEASLFNPFSMSPSLALAFILYGLLTPFASIEIWHRVYAAKDDRSVRWGLRGAGICVLLFGSIIAILAMAARTGYPDINPNDAITYGMVQLLPSGILGLGMVVLFAAVMSTIDTLTFYLATSLAKDGLVLKAATDPVVLRRRTRFGMIAIILVGFTAAFIFRDILTVVITVAGVISGAVPSILGSFWTKLKANAIIASLVSACAFVAVMILTGNIEPDYAMASLPIAALTLVLWQKWGR